MDIDKRLKRDLIADVENVCGLSLDDKTKTALMRCFEITLGTWSIKMYEKEKENNFIKRRNEQKNRLHKR